MVFVLRQRQQLTCWREVYYFFERFFHCIEDAVVEETIRPRAKAQAVIRSRIFGYLNFFRVIESGRGMPIKESRGKPSLI